MAVGDDLETQNTQGIMDLGWTQDESQSEPNTVEENPNHEKSQTEAEQNLPVTTEPENNKPVESDPEPEINGSIESDEDTVEAETGNVPEAGKIDSTQNSSPVADDSGSEGDVEDEPEPDILNRKPEEEPDAPLVIRKKKKKKRPKPGFKMDDFKDVNEAEFDNEADIGNVSEDEDENAPGIVEKIFTAFFHFQNLIV